MTARPCAIKENGGLVAVPARRITIPLNRSNLIELPKTKSVRLHERFCTLNFQLQINYLLLLPLSRAINNRINTAPPTTHTQGCIKKPESSDFVLMSISSFLVSCAMATIVKNIDVKSKEILPTNFDIKFFMLCFVLGFI